MVDVDKLRHDLQEALTLDARLSGEIQHIEGQLKDLDKELSGLPDDIPHHVPTLDALIEACDKELERLSASLVETLREPPP